MNEASQGPGFVHLRVHSEYSLADGIVRVKPLAKQVAAAGMAAVALTDLGNLFGLVKFYQACIGAGVKPIVGADLSFPLEDGAQARVTVLAQNEVGYQNLIRLVSAGYVDSDDYGRVTREQIKEHNAGLLLLSGGLYGDIGQALIKDDLVSARTLALDWAASFDNRCYLELTRSGRSAEEGYVRQAVALAAALDLPVVATNDVCFLNEDDFEAHETRVCIHEGRVLDDPRRERRYSAQQYLCSEEEMARRFHDLPAALANSVEIAQRCNVQLSLGQYYLPNYPVPEGVTLAEFLQQCASDGLQQRLAARSEALRFSPEDYANRLDFELNVINQMGFPGYFLIVMEFIQWAKANGIPVGPGRGSGAGSLVAFALGITDLDPLDYDLLFERFLNPERVSMPDFDVDFCMEGRDKVIAHVAERYGQNAVSQIITFGTMAAKAVVRDVARVQGKPYGLADKLSKLIPFEVGMTLAKAVETTEELRQFIDDSEEVNEIMEMAYKLEGVVRNVGRHAGGVVIAPSALTDFVPLYREDQGVGLVSQFDKDDVEQAGLVKFDFLGLKTLTIIDWAVQAVNAALPQGAQPLDIDRLPLDDPATFELLRKAETTGVFQLESRGMKDLIRRLLPDTIEDIIALVALFRPGPLQSGAVDDFIDRKHGRASVTVPHPSISEVLSGTYGVILYQEQVMQIAQVLAGFTLGQADLLRRAMGKKKPEEMAKVREQFVSGATEREVDATLTGEIFDTMEKFAGYAFNKSHSATYALVSFQTAWLKTHYPAQFMAATLSADMQNTDKIVTLVDESRRMGVELQPPCVNRSLYRFAASGDVPAPAQLSATACPEPGVVLYGLGAIKGVGEGPVSSIIEARNEGGAFESLADFCARVDSKRANKRVLEALIRAGALDALVPGEPSMDQARAQLLADLPAAMQGAEQSARNSELGISDLFGADPSESLTPAVTKFAAPLPKRDRLEGEKEALGLYLSGHPIDEYLEEIGQITATRLANLRAQKGTQIVAGLVVSVRTMRNKRGDAMGFVVLDDRSGRVEGSLFSKVYAEHQSKICKDAIVIAEAEAQQDDFTGSVKLKIERLYTIEEARRRFAQSLLIDSPACETAELVPRLRRCLTPHRRAEAGCPVAIVYRATEAQAQILLGPQWQVSPSDELLSELRGEFGAEQVGLRYERIPVAAAASGSRSRERA
ncbi:MAG: DNA polymerase III subunit alpha [Pseudomonadales bacterium]